MLAVAVLVLALAPDTSPRRVVDLARFGELGVHENWHTRHVSPAGNLFAVLQGNQIRLIDAGTAKEVRVLAQHTAMVHDLGWSQDGRTLASTAFDGTVIAWEVSTGRALLTLRPHPGYT